VNTGKLAAATGRLVANAIPAKRAVANDFTAANRLAKAPSSDGLEPPINRQPPGTLMLYSPMNPTGLE
jgi:hypothetical protein